MTPPTPGNRVTFADDVQGGAYPASRPGEERKMPYAARVRWRSPTPMREQEVERPAALHYSATTPPKPKDAAATGGGAPPKKKTKRMRYLNNKAFRKAQQLANKLPQSATPAAAPVLRPPSSAAPGAFHQQVRKPWKGKAKGKGKGSKKGKKGRGKRKRGKGR